MTKASAARRSLIEWERKIDAAERGEGRFDRRAADEAARHTIDRPAPSDHDTGDRPGVDEAAGPQPRGFDRRAAAPAQLVPERRTITITGQVVPARRRSALAERQLAQPDRIALWAFVLGLVLVAIAAGTAHA